MGNSHSTSSNHSKDKQLLRKLTEVREIFDLADVILISLNIRNKIVFINKKGLELVESEENEIKGKNWSEIFVIPEQRVKIERLFNEYFRDNNVKGKNLIVPMLRKDQKKAYIKWTISALRAGNTIVGLLLTGKNYSKRKKIEKKLYKSEEKFRKTFENAAEPILWADAETGKIINCNKMAEKLFQRKKEELIGMHQSALHPQEEMAYYKTHFKKVVENKGRFELEGQIKTKNGEIIPTRMVGYSTELENKKILVGIFHNITEEHATKQALEESQEIYKNLSEQNLAGIGIAKNEEIIYTNEYGASLLGISLKDVYSSKLSDIIKKFIHPKDLRKVRENFELLDSGIKDSVNFQVRIRKKSGKKLWLETLIKTIIYRGKKAYLLIYIDISNRILIQQQLKNSEEKYRILFKKSPESIILSTIQGKVIDVNPSSEIIFDINKDDIIGKHYSKAANFTNKQIELFSQRTQNLLNGIKQEPLEFKITKLNGQVSWISFDMALVNLQGKQMLITIIQDISERKKVLQRLKESEKRYRELFESSIDGIAMTNLDGRIIDCNEAFVKMLGYRKERLKNLTYFDITPQKWHKKEDEIIKTQVMVRGYSEEYEKEYIRKDGTVIPISLKTWLRSDNEGNPSGFWAIVRNITERKKAQKKLKESELKYRHIFKNSPFSISLLTLDGKVIDCNKATNTLLTVMDTDDLIGHTYREFFSVDEKDKHLIKMFDNKFRRVIKTESSSSFEFPIHKTLTGGYIWVNAHISLLKIGKKRLIQLIIQDITDRKIANKKLKKSERKYKEAYSRSNFYKDLFAHDINNILQNIQSFIDLISMKVNELQTSGEIEEIFSIVREQVIRGAKLVSNVRILSEIEEREMILEPTNLMEILNNSVKYVQKIFNKKEINIELDYTDSSEFVKANDLLGNVFDNILINAVRHNENSNIEIHILVSNSTIYGEECFKIEVIDNAKGIPDEMKSLVFRRGYNDRDVVKGLGLGLSLVKKIIEIYDGQIWVENRVKDDHKAGSNFVVLIPKAN
ncbi:MAG: putative Histidine kinase [Promethearchaeota archaeon]|nr:MAG: putative Histidine kinase [Candidatus Lokiarchaeota archaeon]